jgi:hypothetical protein
MQVGWTEPEDLSSPLRPDRSNQSQRRVAPNPRRRDFASIRLSAGTGRAAGLRRLARIGVVRPARLPRILPLLF